jgi:hypothetical protein
VWFSLFSFVAKSIRSATEFGLVELFQRERDRDRDSKRERERERENSDTQTERNAGREELEKWLW